MLQKGSHESRHPPSAGGARLTLVQSWVHQQLYLQQRPAMMALHRQRALLQSDQDWMPVHRQYVPGPQGLCFLQAFLEPLQAGLKAPMRRLQKALRTGLGIPQGLQQPGLGMPSTGRAGLCRLHVIAGEKVEGTRPASGACHVRHRQPRRRTARPLILRGRAGRWSCALKPHWPACGGVASRLRLLVTSPRAASPDVPTCRPIELSA